MKKYSYSQISTIYKDPYSYFVEYVQKLKKIENKHYFVAGNIVHKGLELWDNDKLIEYIDNISTQEQKTEIEMFKARVTAKYLTENNPELKMDLNEVAINKNELFGYVDGLKKNLDGTYDLYEFKYSANVDNYELKKDYNYQVQLYAYFLEKEGYKIKNIYLIAIRKLAIRQKKDETYVQFMDRYEQELSKLDFVYKKIEIAKNYQPALNWFDNGIKLINFYEINKVYPALPDMFSNEYDHEKHLKGMIEGNYTKKEVR